MSVSFTLVEGNKEEQYQQILKQLQAIIDYEIDWVGNLANVTAILHQQFQWLWIGFYRAVEGRLILAPFQGPPACTQIYKGKGVCGTCWQKQETIIVPDVEKFAGHIACSSLSRSEIVVPVFTTQKTFWGVLDIDSEELNAFDSIDKHYLEILANNIVAPCVEQI